MMRAGARGVYTNMGQAFVGVSLACLLAGCVSRVEAPVVQGAIKQNWLGQHHPAVVAKASAPNDERVASYRASTAYTAASAAPAAQTARAYSQPVAPLLQEEELLPNIAPAAGPAPTTVPAVRAAAPAVRYVVPRVAAPAASSAAVAYKVKAQDTLFRIARAHNTTTQAIMAANNLRDVADIQPGKVLVIPAQTRSTTPSLAESIKNYLETPPSAVALNEPVPEMPEPVAVSEPVPTAPVAVAETAPTPTPAPVAYDMARIEPAAGLSPKAAHVSAAVTRHKVAVGETIYRISKAYGVSVLDIMAANDLAKPEALQAGMLVNIPPSATAEPAAPVASVVKVGVKQPAVPATGGSLRPATDLGVTEATRATIAAQQAALAEASSTRAYDPDKGTDSASSVRPLKKPKPLQDADRLKAELKRGTVDRAAAAQSGMVWPARGPVTKKFGEMGQGVAFTGINIQVPMGTPVLASEAGTVLYADRGLRMYGDMVLIRHTNGMIAAYAHNSHLLVRKGEKVKKGQVIAVSGQSGNAEAPQVHYELRKNSVALDPLKVLPQQQYSSQM